MTIDVTVLGSGNAFSTDGRGNACYLVEYPEGRFLVDCGPSVLQKAEHYKIDLRKIDAVFLTHYHGDHAIGLPFLLIFMKYIEKREDPLTLIGPKGLRQWVDYALELCYPDVEINFKVYYEEMQPSDSVRMFFMDIETVPIEHKEESVGYRFTYQKKTVAFSGDSQWDARLKVLTDHADLAFIECSSIQKLQARHISWEEIKEANPNYLLGAERIVLTHLYNKVARTIDEEKDGLPVEPCLDGQKFTV